MLFTIILLVIMMYLIYTYGMAIIKNEVIKNVNIKSFMSGIFN